MQLNVGLVLLWVGFFLINMEGPIPPLLTSSEAWTQEMVDVLLLVPRQAGSPDPATTLLASWMYWGWPLIMALLSRAVYSERPPFE